jgi:hypothetical protein
MVEEVEELEPDAQNSFLPTRDLRILHYGEVGIEVCWTTKAVPSLGEDHSSPVTQT